MIAGVVLSASEDGMLRLWESRSGNFIATIAGYQSAFAGMATSEDDGHILTGGNDGTCSFWDVPSRRCVYTATLGHGILSMAADRALKHVVLILDKGEHGKAECWEAR